MSGKNAMIQVPVNRWGMLGTGRLKRFNRAASPSTSISDSSIGPSPISLAYCSARIVSGLMPIMRDITLSIADAVV